MLTEREKMLCDAIKAAIVTHRPKVTMTGLAPRVGLAYDKLNNIANGRTPPDEKVIGHLRRELGKPKSWP